ncbi:MAG: beta-galactosidase, partial [Chloroflexota bacterium]
MPQSYFETAQLPLLAAEFDYFRIPREKWELLLIRLKQMGANALSLTVPWGFHEFNQGSVDLAGVTHPRRDLKGLLALGAALEWPCLLSVGPYSHCGVLNEGLPLWLSPQAEDFETHLAQSVEGWYKALSKALAEQQWPGGPVIALSINSAPTLSEEPVLSKQLTEVKWRIWLRKRYEGIEALNAAYGTDYRT